MILSNGCDDFINDFSSRCSKINILNTPEIKRHYFSDTSQIKAIKKKKINHRRICQGLVFDTKKVDKNYKHEHKTLNPSS